MNYLPACFLSAMYPSCFQYTLIAALVAIAQASITVEAPDGSFVPWGLVRVPASGLPVRLENHNDMAYLVNSFLYALAGVADQIIGNGPNGWVIQAIRIGCSYGPTH